MNHRERIKKNTRLTFKKGSLPHLHPLDIGDAEPLVNIYTSYV